MKYNKGFAPVLIALIVVGFLATGGGIYYLGKSSNDKEIKYEEKNIPVQDIEEGDNVLPDSFLMEMYGNYDSSGADRTYQGELTFKNSEVTSGSQIYIVGEGRNCQEDCNRKTECMVVNQQWVDRTTGGECTIDAYSTPLTKEGIIQKINEGKLIQTEDLSKCGHAVTCYKISNASFINDKVKDNSITKIIQSITKKPDQLGRYISKDCKIFNGCNGAHCVDKSFDSNTITTCEMSSEQACYIKSIARCEKQNDGNCGWTQTPELQTCISGAINGKQ